jgi:hypothetical protein
VCAAAIATAHAQELGIVVEQPAPATSQPAAEPDKQGTQTNVKPGSSDQRSLHPAQTTQEPAHAAPVQVDPIVALARKRLAQGARGDEFDRADRDALVNRRGIFTPDRRAIGTPLVDGLERVGDRSCGA